MSQKSQAIVMSAGGGPDSRTRASANRIAKALHFVGLAMFLGSILSHVSLGFVPGARDPARAMLFWRQGIEIATESLTVPGLALLVVTGLFMAGWGGSRFAGQRWLIVHLTIGFLIVLIAAFVMLPVGIRSLDQAIKISHGVGSMETFSVLIGRERIFGAITIVLALSSILIVTLKPRLGQSRRLTGGTEARASRERRND
jgi:predicted secreted protein